MSLRRTWTGVLSHRGEGHTRVLFKRIKRCICESSLLKSTVQNRPALFLNWLSVCLGSLTSDRPEGKPVWWKCAVTALQSSTRKTALSLFFFFNVVENKNSPQTHTSVGCKWGKSWHTMRPVREMAFLEDECVCVCQRVETARVQNETRCILGQQCRCHSNWTDRQRMPDFQLERRSWVFSCHGRFHSLNAGR